MGLSIVVPNADFSEIAIGRALLSLSHSPSHVFEMRKSNAVAGVNNVTQTAEATILGAPSYTAISATVDESNSIGFGVGQTADSTVALLVKNVPNPSADSMPVGVFAGTTAGSGYIVFDNNLPNVKYETTSHVGGAASSGNVRAELAIAGEGYELLLVSFDDVNGLTLYHPRTQSSNTGVMPAGRTFTHPTQNGYASCPPSFNSLSQEVLMFAKWPSVLSAAQMDTVYSEVQTYYQSLGVTV